MGLRKKNIVGLLAVAGMIFPAQTGVTPFAAADVGDIRDVEYIRIMDLDAPIPGSSCTHREMLEANEAGDFKCLATNLRDMDPGELVPGTSWTPREIMGRKEIATPNCAGAAFGIAVPASSDIDLCVTSALASTSSGVSDSMGVFKSMIKRIVQQIITVIATILPITKAVSPIR